MVEIRSNLYTFDLFWIITHVGNYITIEEKVIRDGTASRKTRREALQTRAQTRVRRVALTVPRSPAAPSPTTCRPQRLPTVPVQLEVPVVAGCTDILGRYSHRRQVRSRTVCSVGSLRQSMTCIPQSVLSAKKQRPSCLFVETFRGDRCVVPDNCPKATTVIKEILENLFDAARFGRECRHPGHVVYEFVLCRLAFRCVFHQLPVGAERV